VLGVIPRQADLATLLPDRHLGLVTPAEHAQQTALAARLIDLGARLELERLLDLADSAGPLPGGEAPEEDARPVAGTVSIGYFRDAAFTFYYPENLHALERAGAELVPLSALSDAGLGDVQALYIGGGFPETQARRLAENSAMRGAVRQAAAQGLPIYAECAGLMYLAESFTWLGETYPMAGVLPLRLAVESRPQGHGYMEVETDGESPFLPAGIRLRGHEFHYSRVLGGCALPTVFRVLRGTGLGQGRDGLRQGNTMASYLHLHALGVPRWAPGLVAAARRRKSDE
jgi:cobyrinic acid a,c-diamide synthase